MKGFPKDEVKVTVEHIDALRRSQPAHAVAQEYDIKRNNYESEESDTEEDEVTYASLRTFSYRDIHDLGSALEFSESARKSLQNAKVDGKAFLQLTADSLREVSNVRYSCSGLASVW